jgi:hypothetical protein
MDNSADILTFILSLADRHVIITKFMLQTCPKNIYSESLGKSTDNSAGVRSRTID